MLPAGLKLLKTPIHSLGLIVSLLGFHVSYSIATDLYPGGSWKDESTVGHSFWHNYLCDVLSDPSHNGMPNPGRNYGILAFVLLLVTLLFWWTLLAKELKQRFPALANTLLAASFLSAVGFIGTIVFPAKAELAGYHFMAILFSVIFGLCATILPFACFLSINTHRSFGQIGLLLTSSVVINICFYVAHHLDEDLHDDYVLIPLQKISIIAISLLCLLSFLRQLRTRAL